MTYIELINDFRHQNSLMPFISSEMRVYMYLLHQCNIRGWQNPFQVLTRNLEHYLLLSRKVIQEAKAVSGKLAECRKSSENAGYHAFLDFLEEEAPSVVRDIGTLTEREFLALKGHFRDSELIASSVRNLENRKDLRKRYSSLYRTLINWCKNGYNR